MTSRCPAVALALVLLAGLCAACASSGHPTPGPAATTAPASSTSSSPSTAPPTTTSLPAGGPVPSGFQPASVTFVSADQGFVLGTAPCATPPCTSLVRTTDGARTWVGLPAPVAPLTEHPGAAQAQADAVSSVRFADATNGWVFGPALWATHDAGRTWRKVTVQGRVVDLAVSAGTAYALLTSCSPSAACTDAATLSRSPVDHDAWTSVPAVTGSGLAPTVEPLALHGRTGYAAVGRDPTVVFATGDGTSWAPTPNPCLEQRSDPRDLTSMAAPDDSTLFELCQGGAAAGSAPQRLYRSTDRGATVTAAGASRLAPTNAILAAASSQVVVEGEWSGATTIERSTDGGQTFQPASAPLPSGGLPLVDLGFTTPTQGVVIVGGAVPAGLPDALLITRDGGSTWSEVAIR